MGGGVGTVDGGLLDALTHEAWYATFLMGQVMRRVIRS
jgi:hypothetical protein